MLEFLRRLAYLLHRRRFDRELASEMEFHREMASRDGGRSFGNVLHLREEARDAWGWTWIERLSQDLRYAARQLRTSPGFSLPAILMLAIGIGVNVAAFGFFNLIFLRPLAVRDPATLFRFERRSPQNYASAVPYPEMAFFQEHSRTLSAILGVTSARLTIEGEAKPINASFATPNLFTELGAAAKLGRTLVPGDDASGAEPVVVVGYGFWHRHFAADPRLLGQTIRLNGKPATVVGIASKEFSGLSMEPPDVWASITRQPYFLDGSHFLTDFSVNGTGVMMWGRLRPDVTPEVTEDELRSLAGRLREQHPNDIWENEGLRARPGGHAISMITGDSHGSGSEAASELYPVAALIGTLAFLILAVTCGNLGSLLLARGIAREREIAIRLAVGAGRARVARQLFTESLLLAGLGSLAGLALGYIVLRQLLAFTEVPSWLNPAPDGRVIAFSAGIGFVAAVLFGLAPAVQIAGQRHRAAFARKFLLGAQVAGSCVLVIVAGLLVRALNHATSTNPGFEYLQVVTIDPTLSTHGYTPARAGAWLDTFRNRVRGLPGIRSVSFASTAPLGHKTVVAGIEIDGRSIAVHVNRIDPEFFQTMGIPLLGGRNLMRGDSRAVIVSRTLGRRLWPGQSPLGKQIPFDDGTSTVVGISGDAHGTALEDPDAVECYFLAGASDMPSMSVLVKASGPPDGSLQSLGSVARSIDPGIFPDMEMMKSSYRGKLQGMEYGALAVGLLGLVALLEASLGIVGLVFYAVSQRTKEIGIRMALGARPVHVLSTVLGQLSSPVLAGLLAGVGGAAALSQILRRQLYGISNLDPVTYVAAIGLFAIAAALAALLPARRALRLDPVLALRHE
jgi:predicted permease